MGVFMVVRRTDGGLGHDGVVLAHKGLVAARIHLLLLGLVHLDDVGHGHLGALAAGGIPVLHDLHLRVVNT